MQGHPFLVMKINERFAAAKAQNPSLSLRAYARRLGVPASALSEIRNGKRKVSARMAEAIAAKLQLAPEERARLDSKGVPVAGAEALPGDHLQLLSDQFQAIGDWQHFAILSLMKTKGFRADPAFIARRLGITASVASQCLARLERLGLVERRGAKLSRTTAGVATTDGVADVAIRRAHEADLELVREALSRLTPEQRDSTSVTMAIDPSLLPEAKRRVRAFRNDLMKFLESGESREVFKLCLHLFPLSDGESEK